VLCTVLPVPNFSAIVRFVCKRWNFIFPRNRVSEKRDMSEIVWNWDSSKVSIRAVGAKTGAAERFARNCDLKFYKEQHLWKITKTRNFKQFFAPLFPLNSTLLKMKIMNCIKKSMMNIVAEQIRVNVFNYWGATIALMVTTSLLNMNVRLRTTNTWWST